MGGGNGGGTILVGGVGAWDEVVRGFDESDGACVDFPSGCGDVRFDFVSAAATNTGNTFAFFILLGEYVVTIFNTFLDALFYKWNVFRVEFDAN